MRPIASRNSLRSSALSMAWGGGADHLHAETIKDAHLVERERRVERLSVLPWSEAAHPAAPFDDLGDDLGRDRLDVSGIGQIGIGHDRGWIRIDQHDAIALGFERLASRVAFPNNRIRMPGRSRSDLRR